MYNISILESLQNTKTKKNNIELLDFNNETKQLLLENQEEFDVNVSLIGDDTKIIKADGMLLGYSNLELKDRFFKIYQQVFSNESLKATQYIKEYDIIVPFHSAKTAIGRVFNKLLKLLFQGPTIQGFYYFLINRMFVFITNASDIFGYVSIENINKIVRPVIRHEFCHFFAANFPKPFFNKYKEYLYQFYTYFFQTYYMNTLSMQQINKIVSSFMKAVKKVYNRNGLNKKQNTLQPLLNWWDTFFKINIDKTDPFKTEFSTKTFLLNRAIMNTFVYRDYNSYVFKQRAVFEALGVAHYKLTKRQPREIQSLFFQELIIPDEVISIKNQLIHEEETWSYFYNQIPNKITIGKFFIKNNKDDKYLV